jgi:hypothetical protein
MALGMSAVTANDSAPGSGSSFSGQAGITPTTIGDFLLVAISWYNAAGTQSGTVTALSDTQTNSYSQIGTTQYTTDVHGGSAGFAVYYAIAKAVTALTYSWTLSASFTTNHMNVWDFGPNAFSPYIDTISTYATGSTTSVSTNSFSPIFGADALFLIGCSNSLNTLPAISPLTQASLGSGNNGNILQYFLFLGQGTSTLTAPYTFSGTLSATADWITAVFGVETTSLEFLAQGDSVEASAGYFLPYDELYFQGYIFAGSYTGIPWLKNVYMLSRDYWDSALSTPYSGQLFPVGPGEGGPGQIYPY